MRKNWNVTYEIVTPESAEHGDFAESGFLAENVSFRDALEAFDACGRYVEANQYPPNPFYITWLTAYDTNDGTRARYETGDTENRSLHIPDHITPASRLRIMRLLDCYGIR